MFYRSTTVFFCLKMWFLGPIWVIWVLNELFWIQNACSGLKIHYIGSKHTTIVPNLGNTRPLPHLPLAVPHLPLPHAHPWLLPMPHPHGYPLVHPTHVPLVHPNHPFPYFLHPATTPFRTHTSPLGNPHLLSLLFLFYLFYLFGFSS